MANRAIVGISDWKTSKKELLALARQIDACEDLPDADYHLNFANTVQLFTELTPARMALLDTLKAAGPQTVYALAKRTDRNYSNVNRDIDKLLEHGLIEKNPSGKVWVPWDEVQIHLALGQAA